MKEKYVLRVGQIKKHLNSKSKSKSLQGYALGRWFVPFHMCFFSSCESLLPVLRPNCVTRIKAGVSCSRRQMVGVPFHRAKAAAPISPPPQFKAQILPMAWNFCLFLVISLVLRFLSVRSGHLQQQSFSPPQQVDSMLALRDSTHY